MDKKESYEYIIKTTINRNFKRKRLQSYEENIDNKFIELSDESTSKNIFSDLENFWNN